MFCMKRIFALIMNLAFVFCVETIYAQSSKTLVLPNSYPTITATYKSGVCGQEFNGFEGLVCGLSSLKDLLDLDVIDYFDIKGYNTELQKKYYLQTEHGGNLKLIMLEQRSKLLSSNTYYVLPFSNGDISRVRYDLSRKSLLLSFYLDAADFFGIDDSFVSFPNITLKAPATVKQLFSETGRRGTFGLPRFITEIQIPMSESSALLVERAGDDAELIVELKVQRVESKKHEARGSYMSLSVPCEYLIGTVSNLIIVNKKSHKVLYTYNSKKLNDLIAKTRPIVNKEREEKERLQRIEQARKDSIALEKAIAHERLYGVQIDPKICNEFSDTLANRVMEMIRNSSDVVDYARIKFNGRIEVSEGGTLRTHEYSNFYSSVGEWKIKNHINATEFSFLPQTVTIMDTTITVCSWGYTSVSCEYDKKELRLKWDGRSLVYKGKMPDFYNKHYDYFRWFVEANGQGTGVYDLSVEAIEKNGNLSYDTEVLKFKPIKSKNVKSAIPIEGKVSPTFQGGDAQDFAKWVNSRIVYPELAKGDGISGVVKYQFTVCEDGFVRNVKILESPDIMLEKEVIRVVMFSPKWEPGYNDGKSVSVSYTSSVTFSLR